MPSNRLWLSITCGVAVGLGATAAIGVTSGAAQGGGFTVSAEQLKINQNISSAAVKRSNRALNYLAPIRTAASDTADDGSGGVKPLASIPGSGAGWTIDQLAKGQKQYWVNVAPTGAITAQSSATNAFTAARTAVGDYVIDFKTDVSKCSWTAAPFFPAPPGAPVFAFTVGVPNQLTQVNVRILDATAAPPTFADHNFTVQVLC
jgi:hypothetical protein